MKKSKLFYEYYHDSLRRAPGIMLICIALLMMFSLTTKAANSYLEKTKIDLNVSKTKLADVFDQIEEITEFYFIYNEKVVNIEKEVTYKGEGKTINEILDHILSDSDMKYTIVNKNIVLMPSQAANEQQNSKELTGRVVDTSGDPIPGVTVIEKGTANGVITDIDGNFQIVLANENAVVKFSFVGMESQEVNYTGQKNIEVVLKGEEMDLGEVVVTALGLKKESKSLSYNVQQLDSEEVNKVPDANFINSLAGKVAGVTINSSSSGVGGASRIIMRGITSISGNNNALHVVDGVPMTNLSADQPDNIFSGAGQTGDGISNLNPSDIESISVLSGPSAAALYGSAAANGVVLITTKKGKAGRTSVDVTSSTMFASPLVLPETQNTYGVSEKGSYYSWGDKLSTPSDYDVADFFQTGVNVTNSVSLSTGNEKNQTYVSLGTVNSNGIIHNNNYDRYNFSVRNTSKMLSDKLTMDLSFMVSDVNEENMIAQGQYMNPLIPVYLFPAGDDFSKVKIYERYNASRNFKTQYWPYGDQGLAMQNPYWVTERNKFLNSKNRYMLTGSLVYDINSWLNISGKVKTDFANNKYEKKFHASTNTLFASNNGYYSLRKETNKQLYGELILNMDKYFCDDKISLVANIGANVEDIEYEQNEFGGNLHGVANLFTYSNVNKSDSEFRQSGYRKNKQALFATAQLGYKSMVYLDVTGRNDWVSTLAGADDKSFFYPTVGISGIMTEIFDIKSNTLSYMKMRLSYSEVGNEPDLFLTIPTYSLAGGYPVTQTRMPNTDLNAERTKSYEAGLDLYLFKNKFKLNATLYKSSTYNQFFEPTLSSASGYTSVIVNAGQVDNKGIELSMNLNQKIGPVNWNTFVTYALNRNKIIELLKDWKNPVTGEVISLDELDMGGTGGYKMILKEGGTMGDVYVNTLKTDEHGAIYVDPLSQTVTPEPNNFTYAGKSTPKYNLGWGNSFDYKGVSLSFMLDARVGGIVVSNTQAVMDAFGASKASADARDAGGALVNGKRIPAQDYYEAIGGSSGGIGSMYCYSATNVRLSELTLGYDIPVNNWLPWVKSANVSFIGRNLFLLYNKAPFDPALTANTGTYYQGIDYFMAPSVRNLGFSVKLQF